jgi:hypothetical protein
MKNEVYTSPGIRRQNPIPAESNTREHDFGLRTCDQGEVRLATGKELNDLRHFRYKWLDPNNIGDLPLACDRAPPV